MPSLPRLQRACGNRRKRPTCTERDRISSEFKLREQCSQTAQHRSNRIPWRFRLAQITTNHRKSANPPAPRDHYLIVRPTRPHTRRMTMSKIALALAFALAVTYAVPASAAPTTCGHSTMQYDSSGTWTGPYCD